MPLAFDVTILLTLMTAWLRPQPGCIPHSLTGLVFITASYWFTTLSPNYQVTAQLKLTERGCVQALVNLILDDAMFVKAMNDFEVSESTEIANHPALLIHSIASNSPEFQ